MFSFSHITVLYFSHEARAELQVTFFVFVSDFQLSLGLGICTRSWPLVSSTVLVVIDRVQLPLKSFILV